MRSSTSSHWYVTTNADSMDMLFRSPAWCHTALPAADSTYRADSLAVFNSLQRTAVNSQLREIVLFGREGHQEWKTTKKATL
jgi:hypothetical protein